MQLTSLWLKFLAVLRAGDAVLAVSSAAAIATTATAPQRLDLRLSSPPHSTPLRRRGYTDRRMRDPQ
jgi:hypothetical protein